jgi:hypothetical protein
MPAELPPSIAFILDEFRGASLDIGDVRKRLNDRRFVHDFGDQCLAGIQTFTYADRLEPRLDKFDIYASGALNPLSPQGKCVAPACRIAYAHQFARTACLYADRVVIPDPFSFGDFLEQTPEELFLTTGILKTLKPLLDKGIVVFGPSAYGSCRQCMKAVTAARRQLASHLWREFKRPDLDVFRFKYKGKWRMSFGSPLFMSDGEEFRMTIPATKAAVRLSKQDIKMSAPNAKELLRDYSKSLRASFARSAHTMVFNARMGGFCRTTVATNSREDATGYRLLEGRPIALDATDWALLRSVPLPALHKLSASQAVAVREEAEKALPAFRAKLQRDMLSLGDMSSEEEDRRAREVAAELREAARDLNGQLASVTLRSIRSSEKLFAGLALALEIVALSTGNPTAMTAVSGTLAALLFAAHKSQRDRQEKHELLVHQPAYVLLTAERVHASKH